MVKRFIRVISDSFRSHEKQEHENNEVSSQPEPEVIPPESSQEEESLPKPTVTIDASTGKIIEADTSLDKNTESSLTLKQEEIAEKLHGHPEDIIKLAAINEAFYKGILALQHLNLDEDLYWQAIDDLRTTYYRVRSQSLESESTETKE
jgi:hypothetical protein